MGSVVSNLRFAARNLVRRPGISLLIVATLGLGIGANSAIFSLAYTVLVVPYDLPEVERVVLIQQTTARGMFASTVTPATFLALRERAKTVPFAAYTEGGASMRATDGTRQVRAVAVTDGFFDAVGIAPVLGRVFTPEETARSGAAVVILDHALWQARFGGDPTIVGRTLTVDGAPHVVVGVMPARHGFPTGAEIWRPLSFTAADREDRRDPTLATIGRLGRGASVAQANAEIAALAARELADHPEIAPRATRVITLVAGNIDDTDIVFLFVVIGAALLVLLIACANVANLFLAAATARRREHAVRAALGAGRGRIVVELLCETIILGICASGLALIIAAWAVDLIHGLLPASMHPYIPGWDRLGIDRAVLGYTLAVGLATGLIFGLVPAIQVSRANLHDLLKAGGRGGEPAATHRLRGALVVAQIALAMCLLVATAGLVRVYYVLADPARGMDPSHIATALVEVPPQRMDRGAMPALAERLVERLRALPGAEAAALVNQVPWGMNGTSRVLRVEGRPPPAPGAPALPTVAYRAATPGYLELLRVPLVAGRRIDERDVANAPRVAVLSAAAVRAYFPDEDPLGKRVAFDGDDGEGATIVGVVGDTRERFGQAAPTRNLYVPFAQRPASKFYVAVRTAGAPEDLLDETLSVSRERSLVGVMADESAGLRAGASMMATFAALALLLAGVGIYGVIAFLVGQRTREIGVRMALGARERQVVRLVVGRGARLAAMGIVIGGLAAGGVIKVLGASIPGFIDADAAVYAGVALVVALAAVAGSYVPARRAARVDPMISLRDD